MLIEFNVTNYRSIHEKQTLSMVATKDSSHQDTNCISSGLSGIPLLVRAAALYGPNASGKSNLISALAFMRSMVETSAVSISEGQALNVSPFRLDPESVNQPSEFEVTFIEKDVRYQYGFTLNSTRVIKEWLLVYIERKPQRWFERTYDEKKQKYKWDFGSHLIGGKKQHALWSGSTRANALFLSVAVNLNSQQLRPIFDWFVNKLVIIENNSQLSPFYTMERIKNGSDKSQIIQLLQAADLGITDVEIKTQAGQQVKFQYHVQSNKAAIESKQQDVLVATFFHRGKNNNSVSFELKEESHGTQRFFAYAGPMLDILRDGKVLVVDELDSSLHPKMLRFLIGLIQNTNKTNAQLVFTTHNTSFLDIDLLRRDQIWFMEKDREQSSRLYPLTDFSPRKGEALEKGYLVGRYGALPFFGEFKL